MKLPKGWVVVAGGIWKKGSVGWRWAKQMLARMRHRRKPAPVPTPTPTPDPPKPTPAPKPVEMFDDVNVSLIPVDAVAVAGYVDGRWPTYNSLVKKFPHAQHKVSIAVFAKDDADVLDVEPGDAKISEAPAWVRRQHARGHKRPIVYTSLAYAPTLIATLKSAGFEYGVDYLLWSAHYTYKPHLCSPKCGLGMKVIAHATQWTDKAGGKSLDESLVSAEFFA